MDLKANVPYISQWLKKIRFNSKVHQNNFGKCSCVTLKICKIMLDKTVWNKKKKNCYDENNNIMNSSSSNTNNNNIIYLKFQPTNF